MPEPKARQLAELLGGEPYESVPGRWFVLTDRPDGRLVVIGNGAAGEYRSRGAFEQALAPDRLIRLA